MYCPNCGKANSSAQKFCRSCGLNLEDTTRSLVGQLPTEEQDRRLIERKRFVERTLLMIGGAGLTVFTLLVIWMIVTDIILNQGHVAGGLIAVAFVIAMAFALSLIGYRQSLLQAIGKRRPNEVEALPTDPSTRQLPDSYFEHVPSVTESTTELLAAKSRSTE